MHTGTIRAANNDLTVIDCQTCGYAHLQKLPTQTELDEYYRADRFYTTHSPPTWFVQNQKEHVAGLWQTAYVFQNNLLGSEYYHPRVIDYGCGDGWWLYQYSKFNHSSWGIEPSANARKFSPIKERIVKDSNDIIISIKLNSDSVRATLVLEHILDPGKLIDTLRERFCGDTGRILITVPNEFNPLQRLVEKRHGSAWYIQKPHLNYFTKNSIYQLLINHGFRCIYRGGTFPIELFYLAGYNYLNNPEIGQQCHLRRLQFEQRMGVKAFKLYHMLYKVLGWGRESIIVVEIN